MHVYIQMHIQSPMFEYNKPKSDRVTDKFKEASR